VLKGRNYRSAAGQPYTRLKYIHGSPALKISKFNMGDLGVKFPRMIHLVSKERLQVRHNALESARVAANKVLVDKYGETGYKMSIRPFPHIILRENKMIATAGADRLQEGMRRAFGKPTGRAARIDVGQEIMTVYVKEDGVETAKKACETARTKLPMKTKIWVEKAELEEMPAGPAEPALASTVAPITVTPVHELEEEPITPQPSAGE
jgi:large subunit ribosomal protein L10e